MPVYVVIDQKINDQALYDRYKVGVPALIRRHGGEYLARGGACEIIEGDWQPGRLVLLRFPDAAAAHGFFDDPDYAPMKAIRHQAAAGAIVMLEGLE
jgi:uncharacterized protein (DUF1330 family)